eukprot:7265955-Pyramimonas_sp.AAC.1
MGTLSEADRRTSNVDVDYEEMHPPRAPSLQQQLSRDEAWRSIDLAGPDFPNSRQMSSNSLLHFKSRSDQPSILEG